MFNNKYTLISKTVKHLVLVLTVSTWLESCGADPVVDPTPIIPNNPEPVKPVERDPVLAIDVVDTLYLNTDGGIKAQYVRCDTTFMVSIESKNWIKEEATETLAYNTFFKFSVEENTSDSIRCANVTINSANGLSKSFVVCQDCPTRVVNQDYYYGNDLLKEKSKVVLQLNREVNSVDVEVTSQWDYYDLPQFSLNDDRCSVTISDLDGIGANHTFKLTFNTVGQLKQTINNQEVWGCYTHWKIEGMIQVQCLPSVYPDRHYICTTMPERLYCQNPNTGEQLFAIDLNYLPLAISYCSVNDKIYMTGDDQCVHIVDASTGEECKSLKLELQYPYSKPSQIVMSDEGWGVIVGDNEHDKFMIDANCDDKIYKIEGFFSWDDYMDLHLSKGPDGKVWFYNSWQQMYRIESAEGPFVRPMEIDSKFNRPDLYYMGGHWSKALWKRGEQKLLVICSPGSQAIIDFSNGTYPYHTLINSLLGLAIEFDLTKTIGDDIIWWAREIRDMSGLGTDFMILENETCLFWNDRMKVPISSFEMLHDSRTMLASYIKGENSTLYTYFMTYDIESFYSRINLAKANAL